MKGRILGKATQLVLTKKLHEELPGLAVGRGGYQSTFGRVLDSVKIIDGKPVAHVYTKDMEKLQEWAQRNDAGSWQDWARAALAENAKPAAQ